MAIKIEMLRCFCVVAQTGNLSEAAATCFTALSNEAKPETVAQPLYRHFTFVDAAMRA